MAMEGVRFTDFYAGAPVCTPSRAGLLTGCYARRVDLDRDAKDRWVLFPVAQKGINPEEKTIPEVLRDAGYSTAIIGKWHLGDQPVFNPTRHGFDYWYGIPYSNDMELQQRGDPPLPLMRNNEIIEQCNKHFEFDQSTLTKRYTDEALKWIDRNSKDPFFLYLAHTMPHNPVNAREQFMDRTRNPKRGFGAAVAEISWSTGELLDYLKTQGLDENTLVIFTSDNGGKPRWGASNGILRGEKGQTFEGGVRVPFIAKWTGRIPASSVCYNPASVIDFFATFSSLANVIITDELKRDGRDISEYLFEPAKPQDERPYFYWHYGHLEAVRFGDWKLKIEGDFSKNVMSDTVLFNLISDPGEEINVADQHSALVSKMISLMEREKQELGSGKIQGPGVRTTHRVETPVPVFSE